LPESNHPFLRARRCGRTDVFLLYVTSFAEALSLHGTDRVNRHAGEAAVINGDIVPGFMSAMTMSYKIKLESMLSHLAARDRISADVVVIEPGP
jgi:Cu/Ag efflux protein CusF